MNVKKRSPLPSLLADLRLPRYGTTSVRPTSRKDSENEDVVFGVNSLSELIERIDRGFARPVSEKKATK